MTVYVVIHAEYGDYHIEAIYDSREKAEKHVRESRMMDHEEIEEWDVK